MKKLQDPQEQIYRYIITYTQNNAYPPSVREICSALGLKSTSTVHMHLKKLEAGGFITRDQSKQRAIHINGIAPETLTTPHFRHEIPIVGKVAAGQPILAMDNIEGTLPLPDQLLHGASSNEVFMLRVQGDSMINAGIHPGDLIVVNSSLYCADGEICVARIEGETATVKRLYREKNRIRLQPDNDAYQPIYASCDTVEIIGKVTNLLREF